MPVVFNGITRQIEVTDPSIFDLEAGRELYSAWKRWQQEDPINAGYAPAFRTFGGDTTAPGQSAPKYYFLQNYWRVYINNGNVVSIALNLYSDNYTTPYVVAAGSGVSDRNSDAVNLNNETVEFASFNGGVTIDLDNTTGYAKAGIVFPIGTRQNPCNNLVDANTIALARGFTTIYVIKNATISNEASWIGFEFKGESALKTTITIASVASVYNCEFYDATVTGTLDGNSQIERSVITDLDFVDGFIFNCALGPGTTYLGTSVTSNIFASFSTVPGTDTPIIDMNSTGSLALRDYNGGIKLINYSGTGSHSIDLAAGQVILDSTTITSGTFVVRGVGKLIDENGTPITSGTWNGGVTIINELLVAGSTGGGATASEIADAVWDELIAEHTVVGSVGEALDAAGGATAVVWTTNEKKQIRDVLGIDGPKRVAKGGQLQEKSEQPENEIINRTSI